MGTGCRVGDGFGHLRRLRRRHTKGARSAGQCRRRQSYYKRIVGLQFIFSKISHNSALEGIQEANAEVVIVAVSYLRIGAGNADGRNLCSFESVAAGNSHAGAIATGCGGDTQKEPAQQGNAGGDKVPPRRTAY